MKKLIQYFSNSLLLKHPIFTVLNVYNVLVFMLYSETNPDRLPTIFWQSFILWIVIVFFISLFPTIFITKNNVKSIYYRTVSIIITLWVGILLTTYAVNNGYPVSDRKIELNKNQSQNPNEIDLSEFFDENGNYKND